MRNQIAVFFAHRLVLLQGLWTALLLLAAPARTQAELVFTVWNAIEGGTNRAEGVLGGVRVTLTSNSSEFPLAVAKSLTVFNQNLFSPPLETADVAYIVGLPAPAASYTLAFSAPVKNPVLHLSSLASVLTFDATNLTKLSGDAVFTVSESVVTGSYNDSPVGYDANGSVRGEGSFTRITFTAEALSGFVPPDGIALQFGAEVSLLKLTIVKSGPEVIVTWPRKDAEGYHLEASTSLSSMNWGVINQAVMEDGDNFKAVMPVSGDGLFLRLAR